MSEMLTHSGDSSARSERRRTRREHPISLVYVEVGTENGGIVTDLSEEGAGLQAVAPLDRGSKISLRFELAGLRTRIDTNAVVTWVSDSRRHAGLQFVDFPAEVRAQVRGWLRSQRVAPVDDQKQVYRPLQTQPEMGTSTVGKWTNLLSGAELPDRNRGTDVRIKRPLQARGENGDAAQGTADKLPPAASGLPLHGFLREIAVAKQSAGEQRSKQQEPDSVSRLEQETDRAMKEPAGAPDARMHERGEVIHWPADSTGREFGLPSSSRALAAASEAPLVSSGNQKAAIDGAAGFRAAPASTSGRFWKPAVLAVGLIAVLLAAFDAGRWLATSSTRATLQPMNTTEQEAQAEKSGNQRTGVIAGTAGTVPNVRGHRKRSSRGDSVYKEAVPLQPPVTTDVVPAATPAPIESAPPVHVAVVPVPPLPSPAPKSNSAPVTTSTNMPAPRVVDGRVLTAMDRFNPPHLIYRFSPDYPAEAKEENIEGTVVLHVKIDASGSVQDAKFVSGPSALVAAAIVAVRNWRYLPALLNGDPVSTEQDVRLEFRLPGEGAR